MTREQAEDYCEQANRVAHDTHDEVIRAVSCLQKGDIAGAIEHLEEARQHASLIEGWIGDALSAASSIELGG